MDRRVERVIILMREGLHHKVTVEDLARQVNLSPSHLRRLFRAEVGTSPTQYLKVLRMQRAKALLETTFLTVKEVMAEVGVSDKSYFVRSFRRIHGATPTQHRRRSREN